MPELPEVETIVRQLRKFYLNKRIVSITAKPVILFKNVSSLEFEEALHGKLIERIDRHGKFMFWKVEDLYIVFHLGMSGIFIRDVAASLYPQHIHVSFTFADQSNLYFQDVRKFGKIELHSQQPDFAHLGIDPTKQNFTLINLKKLLNLKKMNIKSFLMDQRIIAGIGNIYANEILFFSGINPYRIASTLEEEEIEKLYRMIKKILTDAIKKFGTSYTAYRTIEGIEGDNQNFLKVYQKMGTPCPQCGQELKKVVQNSRSTFYCAKCQI